MPSNAPLSQHPVFSKSASAISALNTAVIDNLDKRVITVIRLGRSQLSSEDVSSVAVLTANLNEMTAMLINQQGFKRMGIRTKSGVKTATEGEAVILARMMIGDWAKYSRVAFEEVVMLVCGREIRIFLKAGGMDLAPVKEEGKLEKEAKG